jgi:co-chaperonin GroES (HSP10)|tara:strand:+ start:2887 stop:3144 length:258 start_codon:yes stop_codon:yes gene_type:complete
MIAINKYIIVENVKEEMKTESGLLLSEQDAEQFRYRKAKVVTPGTEVKSINKNDIIYYDKRAGYQMVLEGLTCSIIREQDVVVVL